MREGKSRLAAPGDLHAVVIEDLEPGEGDLLRIEQDAPQGFPDLGGERVGWRIRCLAVRPGRAGSRSCNTRPGPTPAPFPW